MNRTAEEWAAMDDCHDDFCPSYERGCCQEMHDAIADIMEQDKHAKEQAARIAEVKRLEEEARVLWAYYNANKTWDKEMAKSGTPMPTDDINAADAAVRSLRERRGM